MKKPYFKIDKAGNVINLKSELKKDIQFGSGEDTIMVHVKAPVTKVLDEATKAIQEAQL